MTLINSSIKVRIAMLIVCVIGLTALFTLIARVIRRKEEREVREIKGLRREWERVKLALEELKRSYNNREISYKVYEKLSNEFLRQALDIKFRVEEKVKKHSSGNKFIEDNLLKELRSILLEITHFTEGTE